MIIRNAAACKACGDVIQSTSQHNWVPCNCGAIFVDGGNAYFRAGGNEENIEFLYVSTDKPFVPESAQLEHSDIILTAHHSEICVGSVCALHKRTNHSMREWQQGVELVGSTLVLTRTCEHGKVHTDPDDFYVYDLDYCKKCKAPKQGINF